MTEPRQDDPYRTEREAFARYLEGGGFSPRTIPKLLWESFLALVEMSIRYVPGGFGFLMRRWYYKLRLGALGENVLIDIGVVFSGPRNIRIGDYVWIDVNCMISAYLGPVTIGRRVHVGPQTIIAPREPIEIGDYVGLSSGVRIYAGSEHPIGGKRMSGPMVPEHMKAVHSKAIVLRKDSFVGTNGVLLPGAELGEGAVVGANSVISKPVEAWTIVVGTGRVIGRRDPVTVEDI